jgi:hypothetical protein
VLMLKLPGATLQLNPKSSEPNRKSLMPELPLPTGGLAFSVPAKNYKEVALNRLRSKHDLFAHRCRATRRRSHRALPFRVKTPRTRLPNGVSILSY